MGLGALHKQYDCDIEAIQNDPGLSSCSAEKLCSKDWIYRDPLFQYPGNLRQVPLTFYFLGFVLFTLIALLVLIYRHKPEVFQETSDRRHGYLYPVGTLISMSIIGLAFGVALTRSVILGWDRLEKEATVGYDQECKVIHVTLSPWKYYFDVDKFALALRIVKMWFNA